MHRSLRQGRTNCLTWVRGPRLVATVSLVAIVIGCSHVGTNAPSPSGAAPTAPSVATSVGPSSIPSETPTTSAAPTPTTAPTPTPDDPTLPPTPTLSTPTPAATLLPSPSHASGLAASNRFWENWYETCWFGAFDIVSSLENITRQSDVVVRGSILDLYTKPDNRWNSAFVSVSIHEVLKGEPVSRVAGTVEVHIGFVGDDLEDLKSKLPSHDHLWFLEHEHTRDPRIEPGGFTYYTTDYEQVSVLRGIGGVVRVIMPDAIANAYSRRHYPVPLDGTSFEDLVDRVRELAEGQSAAAQLLASWSPPDEPDRNRFTAC